jgi:hypothetical protein
VSLAAAVIYKRKILTTLPTAGKLFEVVINNVKNNGATENVKIIFRCNFIEKKKI